MANFHTRSSSFPSQSHPVMESVEDQLCRLKSSEAASTSGSSVCATLDRVQELHEGIISLIQVTSIQQAFSQEQGQNFINGLLEGSLRLVDLCGFSRDILQLTKGAVQELESSIRRNKAETASVIDFNSYVASRNKIKKMIAKYAKNLKSFNKNYTEITGSDGDLKEIGTMLKEAEAQAFSALKSVLILVSGEKERSKQASWSLLSKLIKTNHIHSDFEQESSVEDLCSLDIPKSQKGMDCVSLQKTLKQLRASEMTIQELDEGLDALFRSLVKTRVSLLNVVSR